MEHRAVTDDLQQLELTFKPVITRGPKSAERRSSISEHLYNEAQKLEKKRKELQDEDMKKRAQKFARASQNSSAIVDKLVRTRIQQIFELLDSDRDGYISVDDISLENLSAEVLEAFGPLFIELEDLQATLNFEQFQDASLRLLKVE